MKIHFQIQWNIINRIIREAGLNAVLAWILAMSTFVVLSKFLFEQYEYAALIYPGIPLFLLVRLAHFKRQEFLRICYGGQKFYQIRFLENFVLSFPFLICLIIFQHYLIAILLLIITFVFALFQWKSKFQFIVPTPFQRHPFEFIVGFRKTFLIIALSFGLAIIAISVNNFNLGLFALISGFLISMSYYSFVEDTFYVWNQKQKPKGFLFKKIQQAVILNSLLFMPITILLSFFFSENICQILILYGVGNFFLAYIIFIKYSAFPSQIGIKESIVLAISIYFPPLMLITIPYFYFQSFSSLSKVLK